MIKNVYFQVKDIRNKKKFKPKCRKLAGNFSQLVTLLKTFPASSKTPLSCQNHKYSVQCRGFYPISSCDFIPSNKHRWQPEVTHISSPFLLSSITKITFSYQACSSYHVSRNSRPRAGHILFTLQHPCT